MCQWQSTPAWSLVRTTAPPITLHRARWPTSRGPGPRAECLGRAPAAPCHPTTVLTPANMSTWAQTPRRVSPSTPGLRDAQVRPIMVRSRARSRSVHPPHGESLQLQTERWWVPRENPAAVKFFDVSDSDFHNIPQYSSNQSDKHLYWSAHASDIRTHLCIRKGLLLRFIQRNTWRHNNIFWREWEKSGEKNTKYYSILTRLIRGCHVSSLSQTNGLSKLEKELQLSIEIVGQHIC